MSIFPADPYYDDVVVLLDFEGPDGATTTTDAKGNAVTINGSGQIDTAQSAFATSSYLCDGAATFSCQPLVDASLASGDFTIELWHRPDGTQSGDDRIFQTRDGDLYAGITIGYFSSDSTKLRWGYDVNGVAGWDYLSGGTSITDNVWSHIALVRNGSNFSFYINGVLGSSTTYAGSIYLSGSDTCIIGAQTVGGPRANGGWIDNFRITARARYTGDFRPPRGPFPERGINTDNFPIEKSDPHFSTVELLLPFEGTDGATTFTDLSNNNYTMSSSGANLGTTQVKFEAPFKTTSAEITGALGNSITTTASPLNETMSWTIETWIYPIAPAYGGGSRPDPFHPIAYQYSGGGNSDQGIYVRSNGFLAFYRGSGHTDATANYSWSRGLPGSPQLPIQFDEWTHVAVCYDVGSPRVMTAFINGNQCNELPAVINGGWFDSANPFRIGDWFHPSYSAFRSTANAHYSDYRISSFVRYTGDFRPSRGPLPTQ